MKLAPEVIFDEAKHEYFYRGKKLSGITGVISKKLGLKYSNEFVGEHAEEGIHVHKAIQKWIETGDSGSVHPGVTWLTGIFGKYYLAEKLYSEVLVSDFDKYASAVDIISDTGSGLILFDIKKGKFNREYVTWQLSIYKHFIENSVLYAPPVKECVCISLKDKEFYPIFPKTEVDVKKLLYK